jgi:hypothetical protein
LPVPLHGLLAVMVRLAEKPRENLRACTSM